MHTRPEQDWHDVGAKAGTTPCQEDIKTSRYARSTVEQEHNDTGRLQWCAGSCGRIGRGPLNKRPGRHLRDSLSYQLVRTIPKPPFDRTIRRDAFSLCLLRVACIPF